MNPLDALKYGTIGLCGLLTYLAYLLLAKEQQREHPRAEFINLIKLFMVLAVVSFAVGLSSQLPFFRSGNATEAPTHWSSGYDPSFFSGKWQVDDAKDLPFQDSTPKYTYSGVLEGSVEGNNLILSGDLTTFKKETGAVSGKAPFIARGPISNNQVAMTFNYDRKEVHGFGTAFIEFDGAGNGVMYLVARITRPEPGKGDIDLAEMHLHRVTQ